MLKVHIFCPLPDMLESPLSAGVVRKAVGAGALEVYVHDLHTLSPDPHHKIDDSPYGGGPGMVVRVDVVAAALESVFGDGAETLRESFPVILLGPQGERFDQDTARSLAAQETVVLLCGRYEGVDERVFENLASAELSLGDFVLSGGETAAAVVVEAVARLLPGVLGNEESLAEESFTSGILEYPHYTRPASFRGWDVPEVLLSGNHAAVAEWRARTARERTARRRPDLLE